MSAVFAATTTTDLPTGSLLLWTALPYVCLAILIVGLVWRYRFDKFGWSTRSSQISRQYITSPRGQSPSWP